MTVRVYVLLLKYGGFVYGHCYDESCLLDWQTEIKLICPKTAPTRALDWLCGLEPLHLFIQKEAARAAPWEADWTSQYADYRLS